MTTTVKPSQLRDLLALTIPAREPVLITGAPGIGKSDIVEQACATAGADVVLMHPTVSDPTDFKGLPALVDGGAQFLPFGDLQALINAERPTVCFLDDLGQATPAVQSAAMQLILARRVNGHKVADCVTFIGATNRRGDRGNVSGILEPVKSRFTIVELAPDLAEWRTGFAIPRAVAPEIIAFLSFRPELLCAFVPTADMTNSPCPRSWAAVSRLMKLGLSKGLQVPAIEGRVGEGAAVEFVAFLRIWQSMVSPDVVLTAPDTAPIPNEPSAMYALATAIADRVRSGSMGRYCRYIERLMADSKAEFAAVSVKLALARDPTLANCAEFIQMVNGPLGSLMVGE